MVSLPLAALAAFIAWRSVQSEAPHVVPSVSALDLTVKGVFALAGLATIISSSRLAARAAATSTAITTQTPPCLLLPLRFGTTTTGLILAPFVSGGSRWNESPALSGKEAAPPFLLLLL